MIASSLAMQAQSIKITKLVGNTGQIEGLPKNPRIIRDEKFRKLVKSIQDDPEMLELRELLVIPHDKQYVVIAGNMRLRAMIECGHKEAPCKVLDKATPPEKLRAYAAKDNVGFGEWDYDQLANEWDAGDLEDWGLDLPFLGHEANNMDEGDLDMTEEFDPVGVSAGQQRVVFIFDGPKEAESWLKREPSLQVKKAGTAWTVDLSTRYT